MNKLSHSASSITEPRSADILKYTVFILLYFSTDELKCCAVSNIPRKISNIVELMKLAALVEDFPPQADRIHLANGTLMLDGTFTDGKPEIVRCRLPVVYNPNAPAPARWLAFLDRLLYSEDIPTLQEFIGYCLIPSNKGQRMMVIKGNGGEGKSQIGAVLSALFGSNMKDGSIGKISENRFARADLEHILLCVCLLYTSFPPSVERLINRLRRRRKTALQNGQCKANRRSSIIVQIVGPVKFLLHIVGHSSVELCLHVREVIIYGVGNPLWKQRSPIKFQKFFLDQTAHHVRDIDGLLGLPVDPLKTVWVNQREEQVKIFLFAIVRGCRQQQEILCDIG